MPGDRRHPLLRIRFELLGGLAFAIGIPLLVRVLIEPEVIFSSSHQVTVTAAVIAHMTGYFIFRRLGTFPGIAATGAILPTFALTYGLVFVVIFLFRFDYSRFQAAGSFLMSVSWYFGLHLLHRRIKPYRLAIVPGGNVEQVMEIESVTWEALQTPAASLEGIQGLVADLRADMSEDWERFIADCAVSGKPVFHMKQVVESLSGRVTIEHLSENTLGSLAPNYAYLAVKRIVDWMAALLASIVLAPVLLILAFAIRLESAGPALFRQPRIGYRGQVFTVYKFRTMRTTLVTAATDEKQQAITRDGDDRITRVGRLLRRLRIDELPQIINVLRGEMSWIGPRPEAVVLSRWYEEELPFYRYRHIVRPGITGWAQVNQGHVAAVEEVHEKLHYDFYYIKHFSPWLDLLIAFKTAKIMTSGFGAK